VILLSKRSILAIAAVVDIALYAQEALVAAKLLTDHITCRHAISKCCYRGLFKRTF
jgi:hypothetical protein